MEECKKITTKQKGILKMLNSAQDNYEFSGLKLTPAIFEKLIVILFDGKQFVRQTAISKVSEYHVSNGGIIEEGRDLVSVFKKATQDMQKKMLAYPIKDTAHGNCITRCMKRLK